MFLSDEGPVFETLDYAIRIGSTPTFLYFDLYLYSAYTAHVLRLFQTPSAVSIENVRCHQASGLLYYTLHKS